MYPDPHTSPRKLFTCDLFVCITFSLFYILSLVGIILICLHYISLFYMNIVLSTSWSLVKFMHLRHHTYVPSFLFVSLLILTWGRYNIPFFAHQNIVVGTKNHETASTTNQGDRRIVQTSSSRIQHCQRRVCGEFRHHLRIVVTSA